MERQAVGPDEVSAGPLVDLAMISRVLVKAAACAVRTLGAATHNVHIQLCDTDRNSRQCAPWVLQRTVCTVSSATLIGAPGTSATVSCYMQCRAHALR